MSVIDASRKLISELASMLDRRIKIVLNDGRYYEGILAGFDHPSLNILLRQAVDNRGSKFPKVVIKGDKISEILIIEEPLFDPEDFKEFILKEMKLQEHMIRVVYDARAVEILGRYRVSEEGVMGSGPMAETLHSLFKKYMEMRKKVVQG
ncbi:MAG: Lsm family RNA-binding protein [Desulfurococcaceae archaeon]